MESKNSRLPLRDILVLVVLAILLATVAVPALDRARKISRIEHCAMNLKEINFQSAIYGNENNEQWPTPAFKRSLIDNGGIDYLNDRGSALGDPTDPGEVGFDRATQSTTETVYAPDGGSPAVSVTRSFWMLARSGNVYLDVFICPGSRDIVDPSYPFQIEQTYDFATYRNISYGFQVPFGPRETRAGRGYPFQVLAADKGPYYTSRLEPTFTTPLGQPIDLEDPPFRWRSYNSANHGNIGQNCLRGDGAVVFERTPTVGMDGDNIYTLMTDGWDETWQSWTHGESPHYASVPNPYPGQNAFGPNRYSSTDSLIYP